MISSTSEPGSSFQATRSGAGLNRRAFVAGEAAVHDAQLVRRFNTGDEEAFVEIVRRYRGKMFAVALSLLRNPTDAEEVAQDTFIRAYRALAGFRGESSLATWLHRIALNLARNRYAYFLRRHRQTTMSLDTVISDDSQTTFSDLIASDAPSPAGEAAAGEFSELVIVCMDKLAMHHRQILTMRNELNQSYSGIAETLGISIGTVKSRITRARENLRVLLAETYGDTEPESASACAWFEPSRPGGHLVAVGC